MVYNVINAIWYYNQVENLLFAFYLFVKIMAGQRDATRIQFDPIQPNP